MEFLREETLAEGGDVMGGRNGGQQDKSVVSSWMLLNELDFNWTDQHS